MNRILVLCTAASSGLFSYAGGIDRTDFEMAEISCVDKAIPKASKFFESVFRSDNYEDKGLRLQIISSRERVEFSAFPASESAVVGGGGRIVFDCSTGKEIERENFR